MYRHISRLRRSLMATAAMVVVTIAAPALAAPVVPEAEAQVYDLKAQPLDQALSNVARISGRPVVVSASLVRGMTAPALHGRYTPDQAYAALLSGSGLKIIPVGATLVVRPAADTGKAAGEPQAGDAETLSELVVTGTRIRGAGPVGANVITISRDDIEASGYGTTQQILQSLPQNYGGGANEATLNLSTRGNAGQNTAFGSGVNLRGLGDSSTLVLLNGARPAMGGLSGTFADLSLVPAAAIERVEVLADGASALYGSDAVAGVVNVIFRDRFEGGESRVRYGSADGDFSELQIGQLFGKRWGSGHVVAAFDYSQRGRLGADDRDYVREDLRPFGGGDFRYGYASPGTIVAGGRTFAIPAGQNGVGLTPDRLAADQVNRRDARLGTDILPRQRAQSLYLSASQDAGEDTTLTAQLLAADRRFDNRMPQTALSAATVPVTNPFYVDPIGTRAPVRVQYRFADDLGAFTLLGHVRAYNSAIGAIHRFGRWSANADLGFGQQREYTRYDNFLNTYRLNIALADTNPATAYNLFGGPRSTNPSTIDAVRGFAASLGRYRVWTGGLKADGPLFSLPAGDVLLAVGGEWRAERYRYSTLTYRTTAAPVAAQAPYPGTRKISAGFAELRIPLIGPEMNLVGIERLDLSLAGRLEHYSDFGSTSNPKVGLDWTVIDGVKLKATYGSSFRAPAFADQRVGVGYVVYQPLYLTDPKSPTGTTPVLALAGNSAGIGPERAKTWTAGLDWQPSALPGLKASVSYFRIDYRDRISSINADLLNALANRAVYSPLIEDNPSAAKLAEYYASPVFSNPLNIPASSIAAIVDSRLTNLASVKQRGVDFDVSYRFRRGEDDLTVGVSGSRLFSLKQAVTRTAEDIDVLNTVGNPVDLRLRGRLAWSRGPWDLAGFVNYVGDYKNQTVTPVETIDAMTTVDLVAGYRLSAADGVLKGLRVSVSATNLLDKDPPYATLRVQSSAVGYDSDNASPIGRVVAIQLVKSW